MQVSVTREFDRLICRLDADGVDALVTAADAASAAGDLLAALDDAREGGYGECLWAEVAGEYRWMFKRNGPQLTVVVLWSSGTVTGWQHVVHTETGDEPFRAQLSAAVADAMSGRTGAR